ncbi:sialidase family protein [Paraburkholderia elongata]|uniref:Exo-alpha-sialidase n=1 Tax=Paraburkholderia elongata TaxID=2675747 RepID=A0A972SM58_9BURK|nr:sialidase family protein [Paraburkholderia elongata]NPT59909.1 exo-alpha-sialidase [Paraburkholderia elongata]
MKSISRRLSRFVSQSLAGSGVIALACAIGPGAQAQTLGSLVQVAAGDPFIGCTADQVHAQESAFGSILFPSTSIEPWLAADPTTTNISTARLLVGHQQDRWDDGGSRGLVGVVSTDGGGSWTNSIPSGVTDCTGGKFRRASDPWVDFAQDGTAFFMSLVVDPMQPTTAFGARNSGMLVSRSVDHGTTWQAPVTLIRNTSPHVLNDKNSLTADPTANGNVYAVWDQLSVFPSTKDGAQLLAENDGVEIARKLLNSTAGASSVCEPFTKPPCKGGAPFFKFNFTGPSFFSRSLDNGVTWSTATPIYQPGTNKQTIDNIVRVLPDGTLLDFFTAVNVMKPGSLNIGYIKSANKGGSWLGPAFASDIQVVGVVSPDTGQPLRDAAILYSVAVNPVTGAIYLAWQDDRFVTAMCTTPTGTIPIDGIAFSESDDFGKTWSMPVMINKTPANATNACRQQAFIPAVVASGDGKTVVVTYYDFRNDTNTPAGGEGTDYFAVFCTTGCTSPGNWGNEQRLTTASFNILNAPVARGHFLGDYMGLAASGLKTVYPLFGIATAPNVTAEYTRQISLP